VTTATGEHDVLSHVFPTVFLGHVLCVVTDVFSMVRVVARVLGMVSISHLFAVVVTVRVVVGHMVADCAGMHSGTRNTDEGEKAGNQYDG